jgi:eukaryotic-like serine/threonine-protein kinase
MEHLINQMFGKYKMAELLGQGGMGAVFRAYDTKLERDVAIKLMHPHIAQQPDFQRRFLQEARAAARLSHPGIVQIYDYDQAGGYLYIAMELIVGKDLRKFQEERHEQGAHADDWRSGHTCA